MSKLIPVSYETKPCYDILLEQNFQMLLPTLQKIGYASSQKVCIVTDSNIASLYLEELTAILQTYFGSVISFSFPAGEENKTLFTVQNLYQTLIEEHFERRDILLAFGGGVTGDLTGFAAATYLRGIDFIQIPTSLLSQVDSSIGGKTGVDFSQYKNMVGAFYQPKLVYMNLSLLATLPKEQFVSGMGEIIKHGLIRSKGYFDWISKHTEQIVRLEPNVIEELIYESCLIKRGVVERDPKENGERALLNFGHTVGHAIEKLSDFRLSHGQCVGLGMAGFLLKQGSWQKTPMSRFPISYRSLAFRFLFRIYPRQIFLPSANRIRKCPKGKLNLFYWIRLGAHILRRGLVMRRYCLGFRAC